MNMDKDTLVFSMIEESVFFFCNDIKNQDKKDSKHHESMIMSIKFYYRFIILPTERIIINYTMGRSDPE